jgi:predicted PurR-regulated permease PerM
VHPCPADDPASMGEGEDPAADQGRAGARLPPGWRRAIVFLLLGAGALYIAFVLAVRLRSLLMMLVVSLFLAFAMEPAANLLARRGWRRGLATATVFAVLVGVVVVLVTAFGSLFVDQVSQLIDAIPGYARQLADYLNEHFGTELEGSKLASELRDSEGVRSFVTGVSAAAVGLSTTLVGLVLQAFTVGLFTFYLVADGPRLRRTVCSVLPPDRQRLAMRIWELATESTGGYVYSRALLAGVSATVTTLFLALLDGPYPLALGLWVGLVSQFVPSIGTYLAGALPVLIALFHDPVDAVWILVFITVYQQFENLVLSPRITARTMSLHPAVAFGAVIAGGAILGPVGALLALPAAASIQALVSLYIHRYEVVAGPVDVGQASPAERISSAPDEGRNLGPPDPVRRQA